MSKNIIDTNLHEHFSFKIDNGQQPLRIDKFLMSRIENATRNKIQNAIKEGNIFVNDVKVKSNYKVKPKDLIRVLMPSAKGKKASEAAIELNNFFGWNFFAFWVAILQLSNLFCCPAPIPIVFWSFAITMAFDLTCLHIFHAKFRSKFIRLLGF